MDDRRMKRRAKKEKVLVPIETRTEALIPASDRNSLAGWFALYLGVEVEPDSETLEAKRRDLQAFLNFFSRVSGSDKPALWTPALTKAFQKELGKAGKKPSTINRGLATLRHTASWIQRHRPFPAGHPCQNVKDIQTEEPSWKGLSDIDVTRLKAASETLLVTKKRQNQLPLRDHAIFLVLLHTGLRVSEMLSLDLEQYTGKHFVNVKRKGKKVSAKVPLATDARAALDRYIAEVRGKGKGPLFLAKGGGRLLRQNVDDLLKVLANQANAQLGQAEKIHLSAHILRHTMLRKAAEKEGVQYAMELAGHTSPHYIWRYVRPTDEQKEKVIDELFD
jgi:integrase/recombinase XerD